MRAGSIKRVKLINFMCHSELTVDFGAQVSFVTGQNGSGKSAILAGIVAGFGARANQTNRGAKLGDLVRHGCRSATVIIHLNNEGDGAAPEEFLPGIYGKTIQIERTFHVDKSGSYKLTSAWGKVISKKRADLDAILRHFDIQVHNPVFLMNQDTCRSFLNSKSGKELYSFFYKAPLLDEMEELVERTRVQAEDAQRVVEQKQKELEPIHKSVEEWQKKLDKCVRPEVIEEQIKKVDAKLMIRTYQALRVKSDAAAHGVDEAQKKLDRFQAEIRKNEQKLPEMQERLSVLGVEHQDKSDLMKESQKILQENTPLMQEFKTATQVAKRKLEDVKAELREKQHNLQQMQHQLEQARQRQDLDENNRRREELDGEIDRTKQFLQQYKADREAAHSARAGINMELASAKALLNEQQQAVSVLQRTVADLQNEIQGYQNTGQDSQGVLQRLEPRGGTCVKQKQLMDAIMKRPGFLKGGVIGPCALELSLKESDHYAKVVEKVVGPYFRMYLIEEESDRKEILDEFKKSNISAPGMECVGGKFMTAEMTFRDACQAPHPTVADLVNFKNPHVRNVILDALKVHQILVLPTLAMARQYFREGPQAPNCRAVYDMEANQHSKDEDGYMFVPSHDYGARVLCKDIASQIQGKRQVLAQQTADLQEKKNQLKEVQDQVKALERTVNEKTRQIRNIEGDEQQQQQRLTSLTNELEAVKTAQPTDIQVLEDEVEEIRMAAETVEGQVAESTVEYDLAKGREDKASARFKRMKETAAEEMKQLDALQGQIETSRRKLEEMETDISTSKNTGKQYEKNLAAKTKDFETAAAVTEAKKQELIDFGVEERHHMKSMPAEDVLTAQRAKLEHQLATVDADVENSYDYWQGKLTDLNVTKDIIEGQLASATKAVGLMKKNAHQRNDNFMVSRARSSEIICQVFKSVMGVRGYESTIELDHDEKVLKFFVKPRPEAEESEGNVRALSGGERSFTMVSFLLSLWQLIEIPFRVLDEFDVFMDMFNRDYAMERLIQAALESGRQFIFLTPLAFSKNVLDGFKDRDDVEVVKMPTVSREAVPRTRVEAEDDDDEGAYA